MADVSVRDVKLIQYLSEAYGKERELETALTAHIAMTTRPPYRKRLQEHLKETQNHARQVERRIKALGGKAEQISLPGPDALAGVASAATAAVHRGKAAVQGQIHAVRGTGEEEKQLKNAKTEYMNEAEEIANYTAIESLAEQVGDKETAKLARAIRREEERMSGFLEKLIPQLTRAVGTAEIPASERNSGRSRNGSGRTKRTNSGTGRSASSGKKNSVSRAKSSSRAKASAKKS